jgi:hypothetical protein
MTSLAPKHSVLWLYSSQRSWRVLNTMLVEYSLWAVTHESGRSWRIIPHLRIDPLGVLLEDCGPIQVDEAIGEGLRFGHVLDPEKDIAVLV